MNQCAASDRYLALCGQNNVHIIPLDSSSSGSFVLNLTDARPAVTDPKMKKDKISAVCLNISSDSKYLCASDSDKNVYLYENNPDNLGWRLLTCFEVERRVMKVDFDCHGKNLIMVDKSGDVWTSNLSTVEEMKKPKKILGHCSVILDAKLNRDSTEIFTCDRDEKIRISQFPQGFIIKDYLLGHSEAVVSLHLTKNEKLLVSVDIDGIVKVWDSRDLSSRSCVKSFNTLKSLDFEKKEGVDYQVLAMKVTELFDNIYFCVKINEYDEIPFFKLDVNTMEVVQAGRMQDVRFNKYWDMCWVDNSLYVVAPDSLKDSKKVTISEDDNLSTINCSVLSSLTNLNEIEQDIKDFVVFNDTPVPLRKRGYNFNEPGRQNPKVSRLDDISVN